MRDNQSETKRPADKTRSLFNSLFCNVSLIYTRMAFSVQLIKVIIYLFGFKIMKFVYPIFRTVTPFLAIMDKFVFC